MNSESSRLIRLQEVRRRTGLSRSSVYHQMALGTFPQRVRLGPEGMPYRAVAWVEAEVDTWVAGQIARRDSCSQSGGRLHALAR